MNMTLDRERRILRYLRFLSCISAVIIAAILFMGAFANGSPWWFTAMVPFLLVEACLQRQARRVRQMEREQRAP